MIIKDFLHLIADTNQLAIYDLPSIVSKYRNHNKIVHATNRLYIRDVEWLFYPGMLFGSRDKWWADWKQRYTPHEGLDITFYRIKEYDKLSINNIRSFNQHTVVPAMADGTVLNICNDFLGQSVVVECGSLSKRSLQCNHAIQNSIIAVIYSHIFISCGLTIGDMVTKGQSIGKVADTSMKRSGIPPHLHLSCAEILANIPLHKLDWNLFGNPTSNGVKFYDPMWI